MNYEREYIELRIKNRLDLVKSQIAQKHIELAEEVSRRAVVVSKKEEMDAMKSKEELHRFVSRNMEDLECVEKQIKSLMGFNGNRVADLCKERERLANAIDKLKASEEKAWSDKKLSNARSAAEIGVMRNKENIRLIKRSIDWLESCELVLNVALEMKSVTSEDELQLCLGVLMAAMRKR